VKSVENQPSDVSVKSLVAFPQVLEPMNDKLDWTQKLGDTFLVQAKDVLAAVQRLRARAKDSGNLKSNEQPNVIVEKAPAPGGTPASTQTTVRIEPADPQVVYVPAYNPTAVYGASSYPTYRPYYWAPAPADYLGAAGFAWGVGLAAAGAIFSDCNWGGGDVNIKLYKTTDIDRHFNRTKVQGNGNRWQHDANHRQGVAYRDRSTREKYAGNVPGADARSQYRGRNSGATTSERVGGADRAGVGNRASYGDQAGAGNRATTADRSATGDRAGGDGYHYKLLTSEGPHAPSGAYGYLTRGRLFGGIAVIAWPVRYRDTGVKSFIVSHAGQVYERDLGPESEATARAMSPFDPRPGWTKVTP
jgi:hypothetical protein